MEQILKIKCTSCTLAVGKHQCNPLYCKCELRGTRLAERSVSPLWMTWTDHIYCSPPQQITTVCLEAGGLMSSNIRPAPWLSHRSLSLQEVWTSLHYLLALTQPRPPTELWDKEPQQIWSTTSWKSKNQKNRLLKKCRTMSGVIMKHHWTISKRFIFLSSNLWSDFFFQ